MFNQNKFHDWIEMIKAYCKFYRNFFHYFCLGCYSLKSCDSGQECYQPGMSGLSSQTLKTASIPGTRTEPELLIL